jgi:hypothetical protein
MELAYRPSYAFEEILAAFGDATDAAGAADTMASQVEQMSQCITGNKRLRMPEVVETDRAQVLAKYALGEGTLLPKQRTFVTSDEAADTDFLRGVRAKEQKWRTSDFDWRNLLSRRELDLLTGEDRSKFGRNMAYYLANSERAQLFLRTTDTMFSVCFVPYRKGRTEQLGRNRT